MKSKALLSVLFTMISMACFGQLTITEISYNPPESGTDSLEYIEVYNTSNAPLNLKDFKFAKGITYTFPDSTIGVGKYFLIVKNARAFKKVYNVTAADWSPADPLSSSNTLTNSGEILEITNPAGAVVISFKYDKVAPWPLPADGTDGNGKSIELCLPTADATMGSNWKVSANDLGFMHNNKAVFGTPGTANSLGVCAIEPDTIVEVSDFKFTPSSVTINKGQTVRWKNISGSHNVNGKKETFPNNPESFSNGAPASGSWTFDYTFTIPGTYDYQCDPHAGQMKGKVIVLDPNPPLTYPSRSIVSMSSVNSNGVVDSLNARCAIEGIVHGVNLRAAGLQFTIIDNANNGIGVFNGGANLGYTVKEGDKIKVEGTVGQFNGFAQVTAVAITKISEGNALVSPKLVTSYAENDESSLIGISGLKFADASQWTGTGAGFNVTMSNGTDSYTVRVDNDIDAYSLPIPDPNKTYIVIGLLGQFDASEPYTEGYQLLPRYIADFDPLGNVSEGNFALTIHPNPTNGIFNIVSDVTIDRIDVCDIKGRPVLAPSNANTVDMSNLPTGCYIIRVAASDKVIHRKVWKF